LRQYSQPGKASRHPALDSATSRPDKPVTIVCDPLPGTPVQSNVTVNLQQANGRQVSSAQGTADTFSGAAAPFLTCDGVTQNTVVVQLTPNPGSGPFHGGGAIVTADFVYGTDTNFESSTTPVITVSLHG
jgi:hypothetical protein